MQNEILSYISEKEAAHSSFWVILFFKKKKKTRAPEFLNIDPPHLEAHKSFWIKKKGGPLGGGGSFKKIFPVPGIFSY